MYNLNPDSSSPKYYFDFLSAKTIHRFYNASGTSPQKSKQIFPLKVKPAPEDTLPKYLKGFDIKAGLLLANTTKANTKKVINKTTNQFIKGATKSETDSTSNCCRFVKRALVETSLMEYQWVHAYEMAARFRQDKNFREIDLSEVDDPTKLPAGCILVYDKDDGYSTTHGHIAVTLGDGRTASDLIENNPKKKPSAAFYPIKHDANTLCVEA